jgi:hypothetical protein
VRETGNGWLVTFTRWDKTVEFVFTRPGPALSMIKSVMTESVNPFADMPGYSHE